MNVKAVSTQKMPVDRRPPVALLYLAGLLLLVLLGVLLVTSQQGPVAAGTVTQPLTGDRFLAANPELILFRYAPPGAATAAEARFLAQNPELSAFRNARTGAAAEARFLAQNPELLIFRNAGAYASGAAAVAAGPEP